MRSLVIAFTALAVMAFASVAQAAKLSQKLSQEAAIEQVVRKGTLKVGMSTFEPWAMKDKNGEFIGFEIDVAKRLAKDLGVKLQLVPTEWSGIIPALLTGKFDMIIGGMSIRADRALKVNFTLPYNTTGVSMVARKDKAAGFGSVQDFNKSSVTLVARTGTSAAAAAKKAMPKAKLLLFDQEPQALQELLNGNAHAFVSSAPKPAFEAVKHDELFLPFSGTFTSEPNAIAIRKGDVDTLNVLNSWITVVEAEGWFRERFHYWFETRDWEGLLAK